MKLNRNSVIILLAFALGVVLGSFGFSQYQNLKLSNYKNSSHKILKLDPYEYDEKTKQSLMYFWDVLPDKILLHLRQNYKGVDYLTSCEGDPVPGRRSEYLVGFSTDDKFHVLIYEVSERDQIEKVYDLTKMIDFKPDEPRNYLETACRNAAPIVNHPDFKIQIKEETLVENLRQTNRDLIKVKPRLAAAHGVFAYDLEKKEFRQIGILGE